LFRGAAAVYAGSVNFSRVVMGVAKVGVFCCIVFVGLVVFRGTSLSSRMSEAWAMRGCADRVQVDLDILLMQKAPKVRSCVGPAARAVCQVETTEPATAGRANVKTAPLGPWDCSRRHAPAGNAGLLMKALLDARAASGRTGPAMSPALLQLAGASAEEQRMFEEIDAVASVLNARQALADAQ
jgi:hypothetical protein